MKKTIVYSVLILISIILVYIFFHKSSINYELLIKIPKSDKEFYPNAYEFFHSKESIEKYFNRNNKTKEYQKEVQDIDFDFKKHSYLIVYGKKIKNLYHSYKTSYFNDLSPSYSKPRNKTLIFVEYEENNSDTGVFIYIVDKDSNLRGFYGI